jgi:hypothetical protein
MYGNDFPAFRDAGAGAGGGASRTALQPVLAAQHGRANGSA